MNNGEFYRSKEDNYIGENKSFPAEVYKKPFEENSLGKELADYGKETTTIQQTKKEKNTNKQSDTKSFVDKVFKSIKSIATTATVAVSAVVIASPIITNAITANITELNAGSTYVEYQLEVENIDNSDCFVIVSSPEQEIEKEITKNGEYKDRIDGLKPQTEYDLSVVSRDSIFGSVTHYQTKFTTKADWVFDIMDINLVGENLVGVSFKAENVGRIILRIDYLNGSQDEENLTLNEITKGYIEIELPNTTTSFSLTPIAVFDKYTELGKTVEKTFEKNLEIDTTVNLNDMYVEFSIRAITKGATYLQVTCDNQEIESRPYEIYDSLVSLYFSERGQMNFTLYLTDENGAVLSNEVSVLVDSTMLENIPEYTFNYKNPSDIAVTYNEDGTINVYIDTDFECADESYYWQVKLGNHKVQTREKMMVVKGIPNTNYPLIYSVCYDKDGIQYTVNTVSVSGTVNEIYYNPDCFLKANQFGITIYDRSVIDMNSINVVSQSGEQIIISESDFVEVDGYFTATVEFESLPEYVALYIGICPNPSAIELIEEYEGSKYMIYSTIIYPS